MTDFRDDLKSNTETDSCLVCRKPTRSHVVLLTYDPDADAIKPTADMDNAAGFGTVCHTCYRDHDADAESVVDAYDSYLRTILDHPDTPNVTVEQFVEQPREIEIPDDA